jgi:hypothetical protein
MSRQRVVVQEARRLMAESRRARELRVADRRRRLELSASVRKRRPDRLTGGNSSALPHNRKRRRQS